MTDEPAEQAAAVPENGLPSEGRLAAIDYGKVRIGIAVCDNQRIIASPYETYNPRSPRKDAVYFKQFVAEERIVGFVIGLPLHNSGDESGSSFAARKFGAWLGETTGLPIAYFDERYSTAYAQTLMQDSELTKKKRKARLDKLAAQIILSAYLESESGVNETLALDDDSNQE